MPEYTPGTPSWVDLASPDPGAASRFYSELFDWETTEPGSVEETGGYRMFTQGGGNVGGLMKIMQEGQPPAWTTYISVADADETSEKVRAAGGNVMMDAFDVMDIGRMAFLADPTGAFFGVWQPKTFTGADVVNVPNSLCWNEVRTRDPEGATAFYNAVFGWEAADFGPGASGYKVWNLGGKNVGGMMPMSDEFFPPDFPPHWAIFFAVADTDAIVAKAQELGGTVLAPAMDMEIGRFAALADPHGAGFGVIALSSN